MARLPQVPPPPSGMLSRLRPAPRHLASLLPLVWEPAGGTGRMRRLLRPTPILLLVAAAAVVAYNLWSFCCGQCRLEHFLTLGPPGIVLIFFTVVAAATLLALQHLRQRREDRGLCRCGHRLARHWLFCPACGGPTFPPR